MRTEYTGEIARKQLTAKAAKVMQSDLPVLLDETLKTNASRTNAMMGLALKTFSEVSGEVIPDGEEMRPRLAVPRNLSIPKPNAPTPELIKLACIFCSEGMPLSQAMRGCGVTKRIWEEWWAKGEDDAANGVESMFSRFVVELMREDADIEVALLRNMLKRKAGVWQAAMTLLERRSPNAYSLSSPAAKGAADAAKGLLDYFTEAAKARGVALLPPDNDTGAK